MEIVTGPTKNIQELGQNIMNRMNIFAIVFLKEKQLGSLASQKGIGLFFSRLACAARESLRRNTGSINIEIKNKSQ